MANIDDVKLGKLAIAKHFISPRDLATCFKIQEQTGKELKEVLLENKYISLYDIEYLENALGTSENSHVNETKIQKRANVRKKIGRYVMLECIGKGGMGVVYKAKDEVLDRLVAIKVLNSEGVIENKERFLLEAKAHAKLAHPNLVSLFDIGELGDGTLYLVMEYVEGNSLDRLIKSKGRLSLSQSLKILKQITEGLCVAHKNNIIHRDIKPGNILVSSSYDAKLTDFGLAKHTDTSMSITGQIVGTPNYISPEQLKGKKIDKRSDIYSLGATFYQMLTGRLPFSEDSISALLYAHLNKAPEPLSKYFKVPLQVQQILNKMMAKEPDTRFNNLEDLSFVLSTMNIETAQEGKPIEFHDALAKEESSKRLKIIPSKQGKKVASSTVETTIDFVDNFAPQMDEPAELIPNQVMPVPPIPVVSNLEEEDIPELIPIEENLGQTAVRPAPQESLLKPAAPKYLKEVIAASVLFVAAIVLFFVFKPPSLSHLSAMLTKGNYQEKKDAMELIEKHYKNDPAIVPTLILALNTFSLQKKASSLLMKFREDAIPELLYVLESKGAEHSIDVKIEAVNLLRKFRANSIKSELYNVCISSQTPKKLKQVSIAALVDLFPQYDKYYYNLGGYWYTSFELHKKGYIQIGDHWKSIDTVLLPVKNHLNKLNDKYRASLRELYASKKKLRTLTNYREFISVLNRFDPIFYEYREILQRTYKHKDTMLKSAYVKKTIYGIEKSIWKKRTKVNTFLFNFAEELMHSKPIKSFYLCERANRYYNRSLKWDWCHKVKRDKNIQKLNFNLSERLKLNLESVSVLFEDEKSKKRLQEKVKGLFWNSNKIVLFLTEASSQPYFTFDYSERPWRKHPKKIKGEDVQLYRLSSNIKYYKGGDIVWETVLSNEFDSEEYNHQFTSEQLEQYLLNKSRTLFDEKFFKTSIKVVPRKIAKVHSRKKVKRSTFYKQNARDKIKLRDGRIIKGLIKEETKRSITLVHFIKTSRNKEMLATQTILKKRIKKIKRIPKKIRAFNLKLLASKNKNLRREKKSLSQIALKSIPWKYSSGTGFEYKDKRFILHANTPLAFTKQVAFRMAQIFKAYERFFQIERNSGRKLQVYVFNSMLEYNRAIGMRLLNPAFYAPKQNIIVAGCDLAQYQKIVHAIKKQHTKIRKLIEKQNKRLKRFSRMIVNRRRKEFDKLKDLLKAGKITAHQYSKASKYVTKWEESQKKRKFAYEKKLKRLKDKLYEMDYKNKKVIVQFVEAMIKTFYHEAFHAFLQNFLFSKSEVKCVPLWLNEGLAQFFENSFLQGKTLIIGKMDKRRVRLLKKYIREGKTVPIKHFLTADSKEFIVKDMKNLENSTIHYLQSWAIVNYLANNYDLSQGNFFAGYVRNLWRGEKPVLAFKNLIQQPLDTFDEKWKKAILSQK